VTALNTGLVWCEADDGWPCANAAAHVVATPEGPLPICDYCHYPPREDTRHDTWIHGTPAAGPLAPLAPEGAH
jgi:hypothetical protein